MFNNNGQYLFYGKMAGTGMTGNEDGIIHCAMGILYALQHLGYSIPPLSDCGWIGSVEPEGYPTYGNSRKDWDNGQHWAFEKAKTF